METLRYRDDLRASAGRMRWRRGRAKLRRKGKVEDELNEEELVELLLQGGAPWGFTLRGGTEHKEPLIITKVERGSAAAAVQLQPGDEMVTVNAVRLGGSRLQAISLVKSSHQTLSLVVRRKNEVGLRPHSWHSSKLTEEESEPSQSQIQTRTQTNSAPDRDNKHAARQESKEGSDQPIQEPASSRIARSGSLSGMERLERPPRPFPHAGSRRDSPFSCFSSSSSPPTPDGRKGPAGEFFFRADAAAAGGRLRVSLSGRPSSSSGGAPMWQLPEKKPAQSSPPPAPPLRSDSFAVTKVFPYADGPKTPAGGRGRPEKLFSLSSSDVRLPLHLRQHSDESPFHPQPGPPSHTQSVGSYYRSLQDLPGPPGSRQRGNPGGPPRNRSGYGGSRGGAGVGAGGIGSYRHEFPIREKEGHPGAGNRLTPSTTKQQDVWVPQDDQRITALKTPLLHSLAHENRAPVAAALAPDVGKIGRRSDRYATTLRKEIQQKRAQLQKSRSAAALSCPGEDAAGGGGSCGSSPSPSPSCSSTSSSNAYKDHLKEVQARVLQATSFQRRDLEPPGLRTCSGRFRGRRRLDPAKRMHSFSEPDKMDEVGTRVSGNRKVELNKPAASRPAPRQDPDRGGEPLTSPEQQRLGTFAEYQASWSRRRKPAEARPPGKFRSAENILDTGAGEPQACVHERSRSSPTAEVHAQNIPDPWDTDEQRSGVSSRDGPHSPGAARADGADHRAKPDPANPGSESQSQSERRPQTSSFPPRRSDPQTTSSSSSQEFPQSELSALQSPPHSGSASSAAGSPLPTAQESQTGGMGEERESPLSSGSPSPRPADLLPLESDRARSPSPLFAPLQLTDRPPPISSNGESWSLSAMEAQGPASKVPVRIVHSESSSERAYLPPRAEAPAPVAPPPCSPYEEHPAPSLFSPYTRPEIQSQPPERESGSEGEAKRAELARDIMGKDKTLVEVLDQSGRKTTMDLMEGLFPPEERVLEGAQQRRRASQGSRPTTNTPRGADRREEDEASSVAAASLVPSSSYYNTSAPKAELLIKMKDMKEQLEEQDSEDELDIDLASKKRELILSLAGKLEVLREARQSLQEDVEDNEALGRQVEAAVQRLCRPNQLDKFRMFVGDLDKVVNLLLSLSGRLARVENALNSLEDEAPPEEKQTLTEKRKLLMRQHEDAKELKENLDRRERLVSGIMEAHLPAEGLDDYRHFVKMKAALIIEQRKLDDKVKLGQEQLKCLLESLPPEQRPLS